MLAAPLETPGLPSTTTGLLSRTTLSSTTTRLSSRRSCLARAWSDGRAGGEGSEGGGGRGKESWAPAKGSEPAAAAEVLLVFYY